MERRFFIGFRNVFRSGGRSWWHMDSRDGGFPDRESAEAHIRAEYLVEYVTGVEIPSMEFAVLEVHPVLPLTPPPGGGVPGRQGS